MNKTEFAEGAKDYCGDAIGEYVVGVDAEIKVLLFHIDRVGGGWILHDTRPNAPRWKREARARKQRIKFQRWFAEIRAEGGGDD